MQSAADEEERPLTDGPLIAQSDKTVLLVDHELAGSKCAAIAPFAELERAPEHVHTYRITPLALRGMLSCAAGHDAGKSSTRWSVTPATRCRNPARRHRRHHGPLRTTACWSRTPMA